MLIHFVKMHGCGNDFVVVDERRHPLRLTKAHTIALADRHTGVGCDQVIVIGADHTADAFMRIYNPDGSESGACGNATRCVAARLMQEDHRDVVSVRTTTGLLPVARRVDGLIEVDMGPPSLEWMAIPLAQPMDTVKLNLPGEPAAASMGNPHATFFVADLAAVAVDEAGPRFEHHPLFPQRANIGFAQVLDPATIRLRVWERGAGLTLACGSGACAALVNAHRRGLTHRRACVVVDGGVLDITWRDDGHVMMAGPAATVFHGEIEFS